jgi:Cof subfamily protein (haloacid dehalogenase superfamily)
LLLYAGQVFIGRSAGLGFVRLIMIKLIITDLDNTLLRSDKSISEYTITTLKKYQDKGIRIAFATARSTQASSRFLEQFAPDVFIGYGGAASFAEGKVISRFDIPADISSRLISRCLQESEILYVHAVNETVAYTNRTEPAGRDSSHYQYVDFSQYNDISYLKISLVSTDPNVVERIAAEFPMLDLLRYTGEDLYRFANRDAVKWNAVKAVAEYYDISTDMVAAFGDDINDYEMIKNCGIGVAVKNAVEEVKSAAKYICDISDNEGVAKWLEEHISV